MHFLNNQRNKQQTYSHFCSSNGNIKQQQRHHSIGQEVEERAPSFTAVNAHWSGLLGGPMGPSWEQSRRALSLTPRFHAQAPPCGNARMRMRVPVGISTRRCL